MEFTNFREQLLIFTSVPLYAIVIGVELILANVHKQKVYTLRETLHNIYLSLCNFVIDLTFRGMYLFVFAWCAQYTMVNWEQKGWAYWVLLVLGVDFMFYWLHRNDHFIRFFWATHVTHHSAEYYNISVGFRSSVLEPIYRFVYFLPLIFVGFTPIDIMFVFSATQVWGTFIHTKSVKKMGILEHILVTPSLHRVHHASNAKYLDKNMGMLFIFWDKMFGTFQKELPDDEYEPIRYGLTENLQSPNAFSLIFHEFIQIIKDIRTPNLKWSEKLRYIFDKPGYSHDGSRQTSTQMRESEYLIEQETTVNKIEPTTS